MVPENLREFLPRWTALSSRGASQIDASVGAEEKGVEVEVESRGKREEDRGNGYVGNGRTPPARPHSA